jgi:hypothetical protein
VTRFSVLSWGARIKPDLCREGALQSCFRSLLRSISTKLRDTRIGGLIGRTDVLLALWQGRNMGKHFGWLSLLTY